MRRTDVPIWNFLSQGPKRRRRRTTRITWVLAVLLLAGALAAAHVLAPLCKEPETISLVDQTYDPRPELREFEREVFARITPRPVYPYSLIAGGVRTPADLRWAVARDPDLADHYSDFNLRRVRLVTLPHDMWAYVSYRLPDGIYWTAKRAHLRHGEMLITDSDHLARGRCGNRISEVPQFPVLPRGPDPTDMDDPGELIAPQFDPVFLLSDPGDPGPPPTVVRTKRRRRIWIFPIPPFWPTGSPPPRVYADSVVPELPTVTLGALLILWLHRRKKTRGAAGDAQTN